MASTVARAVADGVVLLHVMFVLFVVLGGVLVMRWRRVACVHLPAVVWGVMIEFAGWICPLTPIENHLRERSGMATYQGDFIAHYVLPALYPADLTRAWQIAFGAFALAVNATVYWYVLRIWRLNHLHRSSA